MSKMRDNKEQIGHQRDELAAKFEKGKAHIKEKATEAKNKVATKLER